MRREAALDAEGSAPRPVAPRALWLISDRDTSPPLNENAGLRPDPPYNWNPTLRRLLQSREANSPFASSIQL
jgi:hypothetical protein